MKAAEGSRGFHLCIMKGSFTLSRGKWGYKSSTMFHKPTPDNEITNGGKILNSVIILIFDYQKCDHFASLKSSGKCLENAAVEAFKITCIFVDFLHFNLESISEK